MMMWFSVQKTCKERGRVEVSKRGREGGMSIDGRKKDVAHSHSTMGIKKRRDLSFFSALTCSSKGGYNARMMYDQMHINTRLPTPSDFGESQAHPPTKRTWLVSCILSWYQNR